MTSEIKFVDELPPSGQPRRDWDAVAADLKANPGKWGEFKDQPFSVAVILHQGVKALPKEEFEFRVRNTNKDERTNDVYIRYIPKEERD